MSNIALRDTVDDAAIRKDNEVLLEDILQFCQRPDRKQVENILLIGKNGAGKSALINTLIHVIVGRHIQKSKVGTGVAQTNTLRLLRHENCGVKVEDVCDSSRKELLRELIPRLPNVFDMAGVGNENEEALTEKLKYIIGGYIAPGTSITTLDNLQKKYGVGKFGTTFKKANPDWKITKIVFVHSCMESVPTSVIQCLVSLTKATNEETGQFLYEVDLFTVITKFDLVPSNGTTDNTIDTIGGLNQSETKLSTESETTSTDKSNNDERVVPMSEFEKIEKSIAKEFNINGALKYNMIRWVSYVDQVGFIDNPNIDNIALNFLKLMVMPRAEKGEEVTPILTWRVLFILNIRWILDLAIENAGLAWNTNFMTDEVILALSGVGFSIILYILWSLFSAIIRLFSV